MANINLDKILNHQTYLARLETQGYQAHIAPSLAATLRDIRRLLAEADTVTSQRQLRALEAEIRRMVRAQEGWAALQDDLDALADYDNRFFAELIGGVAATSERVKRLADNTMMVLRSGEKFNTGLWPDFVQANQESQMRAMSNVLRTAYAEGWTAREMRREVSRRFDSEIARNAETLARTATNHYSTIGRRAFAAANPDVVTREVPIVTFDSRLSQQCATVGARYGQKGWPVGESPIGFPPYHMNCLFEDSFITSGYGISSVSKRRFKGLKVTISTTSGNELSVTPNHPILTDRGWVEAELVKVSDKLFVQSSAKNVANVDGNNYDAKARVDQVFNSFGSSSGVLTREVPVSAPDFHGDGVNNEVAVIHSNSLLLGEAVSNLNKELSKLKLQIRNRGEIFLSCDGGEFFFFGRLLSPSGSFVGGLSEVSNLLRGASLHSSKLLFRAVSNLDSHIREDALNSSSTLAEPSGDALIPNPIEVEALNVFELGIRELDSAGFRHVNTRPFKMSVSGGSADTELLANNIDRYAGGVELSDVVSVDFAHVEDSFVYNIETVDNCYAANGIITHNCRTTIVPLADGQELIGTRAARGDSGKTQQVRASTEIDSFVSRQSKEWQEDLLGVERARLFREGKLSLRNLTDASLRPLTLDEIARREGISLG